MSLVAKLALPDDGIALVATDTRHSYRSQPGAFRDEGGKLRRVRGGWVGTTGAGPFPFIGLRILEDEGIEDIQLTAKIIGAAERKLFERYPSLLASKNPDEEWGAVYSAVREVPDGFDLMTIGREGELSSEPCPGFGVSTPGEMKQLRGEIGDRLEHLLSRSDGSLPGILRAFGQIFQEVHQVNRRGTVSPEVEIGLTLNSDAREALSRAGLRRSLPSESYIHVRSGALATMADENVLGAIRAFPGNPAFPTKVEEGIRAVLLSHGR